MSYQQTIDFIKSKEKRNIDVGVILGSGLGPYADSLENKTVIDYKDIPHFCQTTVEGHQGRLVIGESHGKVVAVMQGRFHKYEGYTSDQVTYPVVILNQLNIKQLIITNSAGGIGDHLVAGDLVYIKDHINFTGYNPLVGANNNDLGPRFPDMTDIYNKKFYPLIEQAASDIGIQVKSGNYVGVLGPTYETPLEVQLFKQFGADLVGMSTVPETIMANYMGMDIIGISCVTNMAAGIKDGHLGHEEVYDVARASIENFSSLINSIIKRL